jgi:hypothetical protein
MALPLWRDKTVVLDEAVQPLFMMRLFSKSPNYVFSIEKDCEISSAEAQINKLRRRLPSIRNKTETHAVG